MNRAEWADIAEFIEEGFDHPPDDPWTDRKDRVYERALSGYDATVVAAAVRKLALTRGAAPGPTWRPPIAAVLATIEHDPGVPSWDEAQALIFAPPSRVRALGMLHPCLEDFIRRNGGLAALRKLPVEDADEGKWERKRLQKAYDAHRAGWVDKRHHALALGVPWNRRPVVLDPISAAGLRPVPSTPQIGAAA